jgi:hypothetical protein
MADRWMDSVRKVLGRASDNAAQGLTRWYDTITGAAIIQQGGPTGPYYSFAQNNWIRKSFAGLDTFIVFCRFRIPSLPTNGNELGIVGLWDAGTKQTVIRGGLAGQKVIRVVNGAGTALATINPLILAGVWNSLCIKIKVNNTTGTVDVLLNGTSVASLTAQNTRGSANNIINQISFGDENNSGAVDICDILIRDTTGAVNNGTFGEAVIFRDDMSADDGTETDFTSQGGGVAISAISRASGIVTVTTGTTSHGLKTGQTAVLATVTDSSFNGTFSPVTVLSAFTYQFAQAGANASSSGGTSTKTLTNKVDAINEPYVDDDSSYIKDATSGHTQLFQHTGISTSGTISSVQTSYNAEKDDAVVRNIQSRAKLSATGNDGTSNPLAIGYAGFFDIRETDPAAAAWTQTNYNNALFGVKNP